MGLKGSLKFVLCLGKGGKKFLIRLGKGGKNVPHGLCKVWVKASSIDVG